MALFKYGFSSSKANQDAPDKKRKGRDETKKSYEKENRMHNKTLDFIQGQMHVLFKLTIEIVIFQLY